MAIKTNAGFLFIQYKCSCNILMYFSIFNTSITPALSKTKRLVLQNSAILRKKKQKAD